MDASRRDLLKGLGACALTAALPAQAQVAAHLGKREILVFSDGAITVPAGMAARDRPSDELARTLRAAGLPADVTRMPLNVAAIRDGDEYTFIDCGAGGRFLEGSGKLAAALESAGIDRTKVKRVLFTHAHADHLWGAIDEFDEPLFPEARWAMPRAERDFWLAGDVLQKVPEPLHMMVAGAQRVIRQLGGKLETFEAGTELAPGVAAFDTGGHTPGHVSFEIRGGGESIVVLGDALTHPLISFAHPGWMPASDLDGARAVAARRKLLDRLASEKLRCIGYHLPGLGMGHVERQGTAWRFVGA